MLATNDQQDHDHYEIRGTPEGDLAELVPDFFLQDAFYARQLIIAVVPESPPYALCVEVESRSSTAVTVHQQTFKQASTLELLPIAPQLVKQLVDKS